MSFDALLNHSLTIQRWTASASSDSGGHAIAGYVDDVDGVDGTVQERSAREVATGELEGVAVSDAIAFLRITAATTSLKAPDRLVKDGLVYQLVGLPRDAGGRGHHLEADVRRITP